MCERPLDGKTIVVIGGTTGLGRSGALACARAGARVVVVGRRETSARAALESLRELGAESDAIVGDASDPATAERAVDRAVEIGGRLDGLYHVAGGSGRRFGDGPLHEVSDDGWRATIDLNLTSVVWSNRAAVRRFLNDGGGGSILNMGSVLADSPSPEYFATHAYAASKAGILGLSRAAAAHYASASIRINVVAPALTETPMARRACDDETIAAFVRRRQPLDGGRIGAPEDVDAAVVYFLSDASRFVTGQVLRVDGGWSVTDGSAP